MHALVVVVRVDAAATAAVGARFMGGDPAGVESVEETVIEGDVVVRSTADMSCIGDNRLMLLSVEL